MADLKDINKFYSYNNDHDPSLPADSWFQEPPEGLTLFIVLYTQTCRWSRCLGCNLPSLMSEHHVSYKDIMRQIDYVFNTILDDKKRKGLKKIILSNNGSVLDEKTFSTTALMYFVAMMNMNCTSLETLTIETRPEYVDWEELEVISRALKEGDTQTNLEVAIGFEAFDDTIRNDYFRKGLDLKIFEEFAGRMAKYKFRLKTYFMLKPVPQISEQEGIEDIKKGIDYLHDIACRHGLDINMHLNPTYVAKGTPLEEAFREGKYTPPELESVTEIIRHARDKKITLFIGLDDEGLAVEGGSFIREGDESLAERMQEFNKTQDYRLFP